MLAVITQVVTGGAPQQRDQSPASIGLRDFLQSVRILDRHACPVFDTSRVEHVSSHHSISDDLGDDLER
jgi:hypothetical protein